MKTLARQTQDFSRGVPLEILVLGGAEGAPQLGEAEHVDAGAGAGFERATEVDRHLVAPFHDGFPAPLDFLHLERIPGEAAHGLLVQGILK
ncbi:MAG: hypothetical protein KA064_02835 [Firmicutes bacterium]|nr:hypothetical protein [Bacillota bacterium]